MKNLFVLTVVLILLISCDNNTIETTTPLADKTYEEMSGKKIEDNSLGGL